MAEFAIDRFLDMSGAVQVDDLDWDEARRVGITEFEARVLRYMADTETHTIIYMRDLLAGHSTKDPEVTAFLSVWVYEELWHGRAIDRFLAEVGHPPDPDRYTKVTEGSALGELVEAALSHAAAYATPKFIATHMTWGAVNELTAAAAYTMLEKKTENPVLQTLLARMNKQERKHFAFYYQQAEKRLKGDRIAQGICSFALKRFWDIVGSGVGDTSSLEELAANLFANPEAQKILADAQGTIAKLPGLEWFDMVVPKVGKLIAAYEKEHGPAPAFSPPAKRPAAKMAPAAVA